MARGLALASLAALAALAGPAAGARVMVESCAG